MLSHCRVALLLLLLLVAGCQAQSGDRDTDMEPRISCTSDIMLERSNLSCRVIGGPNNNEDDEDDDGDSIERMSLCYTDWSRKGKTCVEASGDTISFGWSPVIDCDLTVHLKSGRNISTTVNPKKIVKPRSPRVLNVTFNMESNQAVIYIWTPYHKDYLKVENQLFQLHFCTASSEMTQNISGLDYMKISLDHLQRNMQYLVRVRAIPVGNYLQGSWSEWGEALTFITPPEERVLKERQDVYILIVCLISLVVVTSSVVFLSKNKIFAYMWPSIPHPKHTLVQICKPNNGLLLNLKPEVFSALKVYPMEEIEEEQGEETEPSVNAAAAAATDGTQSKSNFSSTQSSGCRSTTSVSTEELELSALLSRSSSDGEDSLQCSSPSPINVLQLVEVPIAQPEISSGGNQVELFGVNQQEEAYVTMSSFYQIK